MKFQLCLIFIYFNIIMKNHVFANKNVESVKNLSVTDSEMSASHFIWRHDDRNSPRQINYVNNNNNNYPIMTSHSFLQRVYPHAYVISHARKSPILYKQTHFSHKMEPQRQPVQTLAYYDQLSSPYLRNNNKLGYDRTNTNTNIWHNNDKEKYSSNNGQNYYDDHYNKHGNTDNQSYDKKHSFSKGETGKHNKEAHSNYYDDNGEKELGDTDNKSYHNLHNDQSKYSKGGKFGEKKYHKKGSKTTGYHNVFHKDEFKKDHTFYDDADHKGNFRKYGSDNKHNVKKDGKRGKGDHHDASYHEDNKGLDKEFDKGEYDKHDEGYDNQHGHDSHFKNEKEYGKKGGSSGGNEHNYKKST